MRRLALLALALAVAAPHAHAKGGKADKGDKGDVKTSDDDDESADDASSDDDADAAPKKQGKAAVKGDDAESSDDDVTTTDEEDKPSNRLPDKQDLTGHDLGGAKKANTFEQDRFFVDKVDTSKTEHGTLIQGSVTSTSFAYTEGGGGYPLPTGAPMGTTFGNDSAQYTRLFTDFRLQTDFRHIGGGRWDGRFDGRVRIVDQPDAGAEPGFTGPTIANHIQSGLDGQNEYELREAWIVRNGERSDVFIGRQFIPDLGGLKIDGVRVDYASSQKFTLIGFGGLYPFRGSRSLDTDYIELKNSTGQDVGRFVSTGGFGAAYRTDAAYGSFGGVVLYPLPIGGGANPGEPPRIYATSNGYWRFGSQLDLYHFALVDLFGSNAVDAGGALGFTNISAGANYKPSPRLRMTVSYNRVDTETLNVEANAYLTTPGANTNNAIQNTLFVKRLSTDALRGGVSAGLGDNQRFEISTAVTYRYRPGFSLSSPDGTVTTPLQPASGVDVWGSIVDRRSFANLRLGADVTRSFAVGTIAFQRSEVLALRVFAGRELASGKGEWEAEASYASTADSNGGMMGVSCSDLTTCYGASNGTIVAIGGTIYYRFNRDWFGIASAYLSDTAITETTMMKSDPGIVGLTGFVRAAYRF